ncbi:MAG: hypothetical protein JNL92_07820 [Opitutaceae bacterium]|nr:hypothetical protein [Opitutaceae bacterium]
MRRLLRKSAFLLAARWRVGLLLLVTTLVWCAHYDRWTPASWSLPTIYGGDALEIYARIAAAAEGDAAPLRPQVISRLGAPHGANWNAYPSSDVVLLWAIGHLAGLIGVFPAANAALLFANLTAALALYGSARWLRVRWEWAFTAALLFAFTLQTFQRGISHLFLIFSWTVPLALVACGLVAGSRRLAPGRRTGLFCVGTAAAIGAGNPYVLFLFLQLMGWALIAQWCGDRRRENLVTGGLALAAALASFAAFESHLWAYRRDTAAVSPLVRNYAGTELYAMKPLELLVPPPGHRWEALAEFGHRYLRWSEFRSGESSMSYLGLAGIAGLAWLGIVSVRRLLRRQGPPAPALATGWIVAFSSLGGVTNIFALLTGLVVFRATNRFSIFISAVALLFLATQLSRWSARRPRWLTVGLAALVAVVGLADQMPRGAGPQWQADIAGRVAADRAFGQRLETQLPPGAMVFQLPVLDFPEATPPHQLEDYTYFRPYLATRSLCFSYGALRRRSRSHWQRDLADASPPELVARLERYGFAAVYFHRAAFPDRGEQLLRELAAAGRTERIVSPDREQVAVLLEPRSQPEKPLARRPTFGRGWHQARPGELRWAYRNAALSYYNPLPNPVPCRLRFALTSAGERDLTIRVNGQPMAQARIDGDRHAIEFDVALQPGVNRLDLETPQPAVRANQGRNQLRTFGIHELTLSLTDAPPVARRE